MALPQKKKGPNKPENIWILLIIIMKKNGDTANEKQNWKEKVKLVIKSSWIQKIKK